MKKVINIGIDVGSTTVKIVILDENLNEIESAYERHYSDTKNTVCKILENLVDKYKEKDFKMVLTGSGAMSIAKFLDVAFIQEVVACKRVVEKELPKTNVVIELGGEDAKIIYFGKSIEQRMNGTCAGGTGAFLDQMATLLNTDTAGLNELAKNYKTIYPIASRCGVFAKTDIQPLLNEGAAKEDIACSIFQAVVNQTISGLACGRPIRGNVTFLGGPLSYLSELRKRFIETLNLKESQIIIPKNAHLIVAKGAALDTVNYQEISVEKLKSKIQVLKNSKDTTTAPLKPLFTTNAEYDEFKKRHENAKTPKKQLNDFKGDCFIGIDAGSTTSKLVVIDEEGSILYSMYKSNEGKPLQSVVEMLKALYCVIPNGVKIRYSGVTGYGEQLIQTALKVDLNEIETIAHYTAAKKFDPKVTSIVDIGGQDMKYIKLKKDAIDNIMLNEACSSGCGSFIETFAKSLNLTIKEFVDEALGAKNPVDLGSRCTVFMNSKIKQAQKEGYTVGDISSGLSYSVVKNAIQKVMKIRDVKKLGSHIVVQGGTFYNEAVLRAFELIVGRNVIRPDISGLMGAYGMALLSLEQYKSNSDCNYISTIANIEELDELKIKVTHSRCGGCENHCMRTINKFSNGKIYISGNRCEKGGGAITEHIDLPNLIKYKYERIFDYNPLEEEKAPRGVIGIPRVLNMYEDYPFWFTLLTNLGFRVIISEKSTRKIYESGMESMPSESVCYPAKLAHGHINSLIKRGIRTIFYPCIPFSRKEDLKADNKYNCPIVISYSEVIKNNVEELKSEKIKFINTFLPFEKKALAKRILEDDVFEEYGFNKKEVMNAIEKAEEEYQKCRDDIKKKGHEVVKFIEKNNLKGIIVSGRPYHIDPEINHGLDTLITSLGMCVLTEDSVCSFTNLKRPLRVVDQWTYHSRIYSAADFVGKHDNLELLQINSFGCGVDAVTTDQVEEILNSYGKMYTVIKIDEVNNLGAIRIRLRSLLASINKRLKEPKVDVCSGAYECNKISFTEAMRKEYTILMPQMAPIHFELLETMLNSSGYKVKLMRNCTQNTVETGLKYVNNDACYPSILTTGQMIENLQQEDIDINKTAVIISQTGGGCRATNYIAFIRKALKDAGFEKVPVISFNVVGMENNPGFKFTLSMLIKALYVCIVGDLLQRLVYRNRPYERIKGQTDEMYNKWLKKSKEVVVGLKFSKVKKLIFDMVKDFDNIEIDDTIKKPKVGIVGEILIKYHPFGNNHVTKILEDEGAEVILPDFMGFVKYVLQNQIIQNKLLKTSKIKAFSSNKLISLVEVAEKVTKRALKLSNKEYLLPTNIRLLSKNVNEILSNGNQTGEGWFLTAEMLEYIENGISNIVCVQPFACLPNHVVGKGVIKTIRDKFPDANIVPVDYDPGASETNQTNRLKLLLTIAKDNLKKGK